MEQIISLLSQVSSIASQIDTLTPIEKMKKIETIISSLEQFERVHSIITDFHSIERSEIWTTVKVLTELDCLTEEVLVKLVDRMDNIQKEIESGNIGKMSDRIPQSSGLLQILLSGI